MLLHEYFFGTAVCGRLLGDKEKFFKKLIKIFLLPASKFEELFALAECEEVKDISTHADYMQYRRIQKYAEATGGQSRYGQKVKDAISIKGRALEYVEAMGLKNAADMHETLIYMQVNEGATRGKVGAIRLMGVLQCEQIFIGGKEQEGRKNLERAAQWNSVEGILCALYYNAQDRAKNLTRLKTVTYGTVYEDAVAAAEKKYKMRAEGQAEDNGLIKKAIAAGVLKPDEYSPQYARFIYSPVLKTKDKERALFSANKEILSATAELPLKLTYAPIECDISAFENLFGSREKERESVIRCASDSDLRKGYSYRPLCICADSEYLCKSYASAFKKAFAKAHIEHIKVADLSEYDFEPTKNNIFIRGCEEDENNVYFLYFNGDIKKGVLDAVTGFLNGTKRRKFRLQHPAVVLDLSPVLPVCFADRANAKYLKEFCDLVSVAPVSEEEKSAVISDIFRTKQKYYGVGEITADAAAEERLSELSVDRAETIIDNIVRSNRRKGEPLQISLEQVKSADCLAVKNTYGFGGAGNESK